MNELNKILEEIKEHQMQTVQLARTTEVYKLAEKAQEQALNIADVSNRRELLLAFAEYWNGCKNSLIEETNIDEFLKSK
jgi:hypothetical protein